MKHLIIISLVLLTTSCQFFETEKITSETFYEEEIKTIDWKCVDQYPAFQSCESYTEKEAQKDCFINALSVHVQSTLQQQQMLVAKDIHDTVYLDFFIHKNATIEVTQIVMDSMLSQMLPVLEEKLKKSIS